MIARSAPVITALRVQRTATGFDVTITGFSTSREITQGTFRFTGTTNLQTTEVGCTAEFHIQHVVPERGVECIRRTVHAPNSVHDTG